MERVKMSVEEIKPVEFFYGLADIYTMKFKHLKERFPKWDQYSDTRLLFFTQCRETINSFILSSIFVEEHLIKREWWVSNKRVALPEEGDQLKYISDRVLNYNNEMKSNFLNSIFIDVENTIRIIVKNIPESKYPNATEPLSKLRDYVIDLTGISQEYKEIIALFQHVRNSSHHGGFHSIRNLGIIYKGREYSFIAGSPLTFINSDFVEFLMNEIACLFFDLFNTNLISNIALIVHPYSTIEFHNHQQLPQ